MMLLLLSLAAGVAAGFDAPVAGILFAIECGTRYLVKNGITLNTSQTDQMEELDAVDRPRADIAAICLAATTAAIAVQIGNSKESVMLHVRGDNNNDDDVVVVVVSCLYGRIMKII